MKIREPGNANAELTLALLDWFDVHGRKNLPWQIQATPYQVWISEVMLQQTQVATVIPYFQKFMHSFPSIQSLSMASLEQVLQHWAGLGYYSRARNLHKAAQEIQLRFKGVLPASIEKLMTLPGIGRTTAGAILSLGFNIAAPILDGNVKRVLTRYFQILTPINDQKTQNLLWQYATQLISKTRPAALTQALMDLGALVCIRGHAKCQLCPLQLTCGARQVGNAVSLPAKIKKGHKPVKQTTFYIFRHKTSVLLYQRPLRGIWGGLWSFPEEREGNISKAIALPAFRHTFTHFHCDIQPLLIPIKRKIKPAAGKIWWDIKEPLSLAVPTPVAKILATIRGELLTPE